MSNLYFEFFDPREQSFPPPEAGIFDEPSRKVCINVQWIKWIAGVISRLEYEDVYKGTDEEIERAIQQVLLLQFALGDAESVCNCDPVPPPLPPKVIVKKERLKAKWGEFKITDEGIDICDTGQDVVINICTPCDPVAVIPHQAKQPDLPLSVGAPYVPPVTPPAPTVARFDEARFDEAKFV